MTLIYCHGVYRGGCLGGRIAFGAFSNLAVSDGGRGGFVAVVGRQGRTPVSLRVIVVLISRCFIISCVAV